MGPQNGSIQAITAYVQDYLDPQGLLRHGENAVAIVAELDRVFADEGGSGITVDEMQEYLDSLPVPAIDSSHPAHPANWRN